MVTIQSYIDNNDGSTPIVIAKLASPDPHESLKEDLWMGQLGDVPQEYRGFEVLSEGFLLSRQINELSVYINN